MPVVELYSFSSAHCYISPQQSSFHAPTLRASFTIIITRTDALSLISHAAIPCRILQQDAPFSAHKRFSQMIDVHQLRCFQLILTHLRDVTLRHALPPPCPARRSACHRHIRTTSHLMLLYHFMPYGCSFFRPPANYYADFSFAARKRQPPRYHLCLAIVIHMTLNADIYHFCQPDIFIIYSSGLP